MTHPSFDRVVLITGAGSGIGAALARRLAAPRTALMLHARGADAASRERLTAVAAECSAHGAARRHRQLRRAGLHAQGLRPQRRQRRLDSR